MAAVSAVNLIIHKGTYFEETFVFTAEDELGINLINNIASAKLRKHSTAGIAYTFSTTVTVNESSVKISMQPEVTATLPSGRCVYDLILTSATSGVKTKVVEGNVIVQDSVSL